MLGKPSQMDRKELDELRQTLARQGRRVGHVSDELLRAGFEQTVADYRDKAPLSAAAAATIILDGVRSDTWRILVGRDAESVDRKVRESPELAYEEGTVLI